MEVTLGKEMGEFDDRFYSGFKIAKAKFFLNPFDKTRKIHNLHYLYADLMAGTFYDNYSFSQSIIKSKIRFISRLFSITKYFSIRNFASLSYVIGFNRYANEFIETAIHNNNSNGLNEFDVETIKGSQKISLTFESVFFTPWILYNFKITPFTFTDIAVINSTKDSSSLLNSHKFYTGIGSGIRIKNERLIFDTIELSFIYYPNSYLGMDDYRINFALEYKLNFKDFIGGKPSLINYE